MAKAGYTGAQPVRVAKEESYPGAWTGQEQLQETKANNWPKAIYEIERSLRFSSVDSAFLSRTPASAGNRKTWTWAGWVKLNNSSSNFFWGAGPTSGQTNYNYARFGVFNDKIQFLTAGQYIFTSTAVYRDYSAWGHITLVCDTTQAVDADRLKVYYNSVAVTNSAPATLDLNGDYAFNAAEFHAIGSESRFGSWSGYLADIHFIDGQALTPSSFGKFDDNGEWQPKAYTGSYGTNGFRLDFSDNSAATATALGKDRAGSNNWTPNNLSVTAGVGNDSLVDTPTSYGTDTGAGGEVRGNYATFNPVNLTSSGSHALTNGNLEVIGGTGWTSDVSTFPTGATGKWYAEITLAGTFATTPFVGIAKSTSITSNYIGSSSDSYGYRADATKYNNGGSAAYGATFAAGDIIGIAYDADAGTLVFYKNGVSQGTAYTGLSGPFFIGGSFWTSSTTVNAIANFGQRPFAYPAPSGFKALCDTNLPTPTIAKGSSAFDVKLYTGNGSTQTISGLGFSPDLVWIKGRGNAYSHTVADTVRGIGTLGAYRRLFTNSTSAEADDAFDVTSISSDGFTLTNGDYANRNTEPYVAWAWDAGSSTVTNTQGSITSSVRANPSAGFSIVTFNTGAAGNKTIGHGLGVAPQMIIFKNRVTASTEWAVYHIGQSSPAHQYYLRLNGTNAQTGPDTRVWANTAPSSTVFSIESGYITDASNDCVAYCFAPVNSYSAFGSYQGNGSADGPFVYTGFRPRWVMIKRTDAAGTDWIIIDSQRNAYNVSDLLLKPHSSAAEVTFTVWDMVSNGFKIRTMDNGVNQSAGTYVYAAFAESPFAYSRAR